MSIIKPEGKAITRSFRLDKAWDTALNELSEKYGLSISSLLERIVRDYLLFYQWVEELDSVIFSQGTLIQIINAVDEDELRKIGRIVAKSTFTESYLVRGDSLDMETVRFQITEQMGKYAHWFTVEEHKTNQHYFYIMHGLGEKWSAFIEAYVRGMIEDVAGIKMSTERIGNNILVKLLN